MKQSDSGLTAVNRSIIQQSEEYLATHGDGHLGVGWPTDKSALTHYRTMLEVIRKSETEVSVLDFGCGAGGLLEYIQSSHLDNIRYVGVDVSHTFLKLVRGKFPSHEFIQCNVLEDPGAIPSADYVIANGIFTQKCDLSFQDMWEYSQAVIQSLWPKASKGMAFNFMSKHVDWERSDLFHMPFDTIAQFIRENLSRHFTFRSDYGYFDFATYVYRDAI